MKTTSFSFKHFVLLFTLLGLCFALAHVRLAWTDGDEGRYLAIASSIAKGLGQVEEYYPVPQPETITPSGYVWYLAAWIRVFGERLAWIRLSSVLPFALFVGCFSILVLRRVQRTGGEFWLAGCLVVFGSLQVQLLRYAWNLMSETNFLFLTYLFLALQEQDDSANNWKTHALLGVIAACSCLVRPVGIALALAGGLYLFVQRRWKPMLVFSGAFAIAYAPQVIRTWCLLGVPFAHMTHYHETGGLLPTVVSLFSTMWKGWVGYYLNSVPSDLFFHVFDTDGFLGIIGLSILSRPLKWLVSALISIGFVRRLPRMRMADWLWIIFWALICTYDIGTEAHAPGAFRFNPRFLAPVLPLAALYFASGVTWCTRLLFRRGRWAETMNRTVLCGVASYTLLVSLAVGTICLKNTWQFRGLHAWAPERVASSGNADDVAFARYIATATWAGAHLPSNAIIASRKPQQTLLFSGLKGFRYDDDWLEGTPHEVWTNAVAYGRYGPVYLLQDSFPAAGGYGNTRVQILDPAIAMHQAELRLIYETQEPTTRLWLVLPTASQSSFP